MSLIRIVFCFTLVITTTLVSAQTLQCSKMRFNDNLYLYCPKAKGFYAPFDRVKDRLRKSSCRYDLDSINVIHCEGKGCGYSLCVGYIVCNSGKLKDARRRVACAAIDGKCPTVPDDCAKDPSVRIEKAVYIDDSTITSPGSSLRSKVSGE